MLPLVINPLAEDDLAEISAWYNNQRPGLGDDFLVRVDETLEFIQGNPELQSKEFEELRIKLIRPFPHIVVYRIDATQITVVAVYHTSRDPRGWQSRG